MTFFEDFYKPPKEKEPPPPPTQPKLDFLKDMMGDSWYAPGPGAEGGKPQSEEEAAFILDYMQNYGVAPTLREVGSFMSRHPQQTFLPGSTMGGMGFKTMEDYYGAQQRGETYGAYAGKDVPPGGLVYFDEQGRPVGRYYGGTPGRDIMAGRYITPPTYPSGLMGQLEENVFPYTGEKMPTQATRYDYYGEQPLPYEFNREEFYPKGREPFKPGTQEEVFGKLPPYDVYTTRLNDYLQRRIDEDVPKIQQIKAQIQGYSDAYNRELAALDERVTNKEIKESEAERLSKYYARTAQKAIDDLNTSLSDLMTPDKMKNLQYEASRQQRLGLPIEQMPSYKEALSMFGPGAQKLYEQNIKKAYDEYQKIIGQVGGGYTGRGGEGGGGGGGGGAVSRTQMTRQGAAGGTTAQGKGYQSTPQGVYFNWLASLPNENAKRYYTGLYGELAGEYQGALEGEKQVGKEPSASFDAASFAKFLKKYPWLQRFFAETPYRRGETPGRLAPSTRFLLY